MHKEKRSEEPCSRGANGDGERECERLRANASKVAVRRLAENLERGG